VSDRRTPRTLSTPPAEQPVLRLGSRGPDVERLKRLLTLEGFAGTAGWNTDYIGPRTKAAVVHFQETHLGPDGAPLGVDGVVGEQTWWALLHASGAPQHSGLTSTIPAGLGPKRRALLDLALRLHASNVIERPNGWNRGPDVDRCLPRSITSADPEAKLRRGPPWCAFWDHYLSLLAHGRYPLGRAIGSCYRSTLAAEKLGMYHPAESYEPVPGDSFVMLYRDEDEQLTFRGHMGKVLRVSDTHINTLAGNEGNRFRLGARLRSSIAGYINPFTGYEARPQFERGVVAATSTDQENTR